ncbi:hypothetical protein [Enterococcus alishanensis]
MQFVTEEILIAAVVAVKIAKQNTTNRNLAFPTPPGVAGSIPAWGI